jgi:hypothetical protein
VVCDPGAAGLRRQAYTDRDLAGNLAVGAECDHGESVGWSLAHPGTARYQGARGGRRCTGRPARLHLTARHSGALIARGPGHVLHHVAATSQSSGRGRPALPTAPPSWPWAGRPARKRRSHLLTRIGPVGAECDPGDGAAFGPRAPQKGDRPLFSSQLLNGGHQKMGSVPFFWGLRPPEPPAPLADARWASSADSQGVHLSRLLSPHRSPRSDSS